MFRSAIFKLTVAYLAIAMTISLVFSVVLYNLAISELQLGFHNQYTLWTNEFQPFGLRQPGNPAGELAERSQHIYIQLVYFNLFVLVLTGAASYMLARRTLRPIEAAHEQQKRFTADVSHELRTPLTSIKMESEVALLDRKASSKQLRATLESNLEEAERMQILINNLLQLASLEASQIRTEFVRLNMREVIETATRVVSKLAESKQIIIEDNLVDAFVIGDKPSLTQLCIILLENAIKYSPRGATVEVNIFDKTRRVTIEIKDQGSGITPEALPHVFDRFYRADDARSEQGAHGYGLGLSLAKLIADVHGAEITLTSYPHKGTTAHIHLEAAPAPPKRRKLTRHH